MLFLFDPPLPTPTPTGSQAIAQGLSAIQDSQKLVESVSNLTALSILGLAVVAVILYIVLGRNKGREYQMLINAQAKQNADTRETYDRVINSLERRLEKAEDQITKNTDQMEKQHDDYRLENFKRDDRYMETISAFTDSNNRFADIVERLEKSGQTQDKILEQIKTDVDTALGDGTPIAQRTESGMKEILEHITAIFDKLKELQKGVNDNGELLKIVAPLLEVQDIVVGEKRKTQPLPEVPLKQETNPT